MPLYPFRLHLRGRGRRCRASPRTLFAALLQPLRFRLHGWGMTALRVRLPKIRSKGRSVVSARLRRHPACLPPRVLLAQHTRDAVGICSRWSHIPTAGRHAGAPTNGITTPLPTPRQKVTRSLTLARSWATAHTRLGARRSLRRECSFASPSSVTAPSRPAGAGHSGRCRDMLPLVAYPDSWQTRWRADKRHHDSAPLPPCSLKVAGESGRPYRGGRIYRLTRPR